MEDNIQNIIEVLSTGKIILYPTDTIWGLGCDINCVDAIYRIYTIKNRPLDKPFIILVSDIEMLKNYIEELHPRIETLLLYHKRPLTIIYKKAKNVPDILTKNGSIAIRIVKDPVIERLIKEYGSPIVSTSANISNTPFPKNFKDISPEIKTSVDYIFKYKQNDFSMVNQSVIATFNKNGKLKFFR